MSSHAAGSAPRTRLRRFLPVGVVVLTVVIVAALAAWLLVPSLSIPSSRLVGWKLNYGYNGPGFDPATAQTTTVIPVEVTRPICAPNDVSWLATPRVTYTPSAVTITLYTNDAFDDTECYDPTGQITRGFYLSGIYLPVQLSEPLGGRALFDGSQSPPAARPYP